jgi:hypothetical protein
MNLGKEKAGWSWTPEPACVNIGNSYGLFPPRAVYVLPDDSAIKLSDTIY